MLQLARNPTLESVLMVEKALKNNSGEGPYQIWNKLPRKMSYQAFKTIVDYLLESGKIIVETDGRLTWIWDPERVRYYLKRPHLMWKK